MNTVTIRLTPLYKMRVGVLEIPMIVSHLTSKLGMGKEDLVTLSIERYSSSVETYK